MVAAVGPWLPPASIPPIPTEGHADRVAKVPADWGNRNRQIDCRLDAYAFRSVCVIGLMARVWDSPIT